MPLKEQIGEDVKAAMRAREADRLGTLRLLSAAIKQREIDGRVTLDDAGVIEVVDKLIRQRRESIAQFELGGREDLVAREKAELEVLAAYLPAALGAAEIEAAIGAAIAEVGASSLRDMGKVIAVLKPRLAGRADLAAVSQAVRQKLSPPA